MHTTDIKSKTYSRWYIKPFEAHEGNLSIHYFSSTRLQQVGRLIIMLKNSAVTLRSVVLRINIAFALHRNRPSHGISADHNPSSHHSCPVENEIRTQSEHRVMG